MEVDAGQELDTRQVPGRRSQMYGGKEVDGEQEVDMCHELLCIGSWHLLSQLFTTTTPARDARAFVC
jgi:hypothetical protein